LKKSGVLTFITSNKFLRARYGVFLRKYLQTNTTIKSIINFGDQHVFEAITNTLIFIATKQKAGNNNFNYSGSIVELGKNTFPQNGLQDSEWTIENTDVINLKDKIERLGTPLKDWDIRINRGLLTGYNDAFIINEATKDELIKKDPKAKEIIKPIIRGRDIKRYHFVNSGLYFIVTHNGYRSANDETIKTVDVSKYPSVKGHLDKYIRQLKERQDKGVTIYNLRDCAFMDDFAKEKIVWIELTNENKFAYSEKEDYLLAGAFFLVGKSLKYLLAFLNSKLCLFYFSLICNSSGMATIQWKKFALEKVPIMELSDNEQKPFIDLVEKILKIAETDDYLQNTEKQAKVRNFEHQIDELVYKLYGLTDEDIKIVEGNTIFRKIT
jgi:type II restriction/modification system DNA methylase subunit YeeA